MTPVLRVYLYQLMGEGEEPSQAVSPYSLAEMKTWLEDRLGPLLIIAEVPEGSETAQKAIREMAAEALA